jgi:hypothetical protein
MERREMEVLRRKKDVFASRPIHAMTADFHGQQRSDALEEPARAQSGSGFLAESTEKNDYPADRYRAVLSNK